VPKWFHAIRIIRFIRALFRLNLCALRASARDKTTANTDDTDNADGHGYELEKPTIMKMSNIFWPQLDHCIFMPVRPDVSASIGGKFTYQCFPAKATSWKLVLQGIRPFFIGQRPLRGYFFIVPSKGDGP